MLLTLQFASGCLVPQGVTGKGGKNAKLVREFKAAGNKAMQAGAFQKAMRLYTKALDLDPGNAILYSNRSAANFNTRQFSESLEDAESAILCDTMWWKAYKRKGLALIHMQRYEEAIEALEEGLKIVGKNAEMEKNLEFARACQEQAQNLYILPEPEMMQRLESVPVFIVTDNVGQPFFVTYEDGQQVCTFYFDQDDANATLDWIKTENPDLGDTARVIHITLNQAFSLAQETQKQYYEETTRAAAEEDMRAAAEADAAKRGETLPASTTGQATMVVSDLDGDDDEDNKEDSDKQDGESSDAVAEVSEVSESVDEEKEKSEEETKEEEKDADKQGDDKNDDDGVIDENAPLSFQFRPELRQVTVAVELLNKNPDPPVKPILRDPPSVKKAKAAAAAAAAAAVAEGDEVAEANGEKEETKEEEEVELTVDNFNGIPVFQAKGLTLLQNNKQLIPLFFSKWDLEAAWKQLAQSNSVEVPGECDIDVGTLEDVLRRMSESKTDEFESVFFVPSRESMKAINAKFPLDELASSSSKVVKKGGLSKAKQVAARGGTKDEIRAAIREDLERYAERQKMAELITQMEQARRNGVGVASGSTEAKGNIAGTA